MVDLIKFDKLRVKAIFSKIFKEVSESISFAQSIITCTDISFIFDYNDNINVDTKADQTQRKSYS